jgi:hypothetical protein
VDYRRIHADRHSVPLRYASEQGIIKNVLLIEVNCQVEMFVKIKVNSDFIKTSIKQIADCGQLLTSMTTDPVP